MRRAINNFKYLLFSRDYDIVLHRAYRSQKAVDGILTSVDLLARSRGYREFVPKSKLPPELQHMEPDLQAMARDLGWKEIHYKKSLGREIEVEVTPKSERKTRVEVVAWWNWVPVSSDLRLALHHVDELWKKSKVAQYQETHVTY